MLRRLQHLFGGARFDEAAALHYGNARCELRNHGKAVRNQDQRERKVATETVEQLQDLSADRNIQRRNRFVCNYQIGAQNQRASDSDALALPTGKLVRIAAERFGANTNGLEHALHARTPIDAQKLRFMNRDRFAND